MQVQTPQTLPKHVVEFLEEIGFSEHEQVRKCVDSDFITAILAITGDYDYKVYKLAGGWRILHAWVPGYGADWVVILKAEENEIEECWVIET